jgi:hypothetical protein
MKLEELLNSGKVVQAPVRISKTYNSVTDSPEGVLEDTEEHVLCDCRNRETTALMAHYHNKFPELLGFCKSMMAQFDRLAEAGNLSAAKDIGMDPMEVMRQRGVLEAAEEVEGI